LLPDKSFLVKTGDVDYYSWNYRFPIKYIQQYRFKKIVELLGEKKYPSLLEVGMGSGVFLPELAKHCNQLYGCDIHSNFEPIFQLLKSYNITDFHLSKQNIEGTDYPSKSFDAIVAVSVLEFVENLDFVFAEIYRILKDDGIFVTICPMESPLLDFFLSFYTNRPPSEEFKDSRTSVTKRLEENFKVVKKGYMVPLLGKIFPVYTHYKLQKAI